MVREMRSSQQGNILQHYYTVVVRARESDKLHMTFPTANYETQAQEKASMRCHCTEKGMAASTRDRVFCFCWPTSLVQGTNWVLWGFGRVFTKLTAKKIYRK